MSGDPERDPDHDSLRRVARLVAHEVDVQRVFEGMAEELVRVVGADAAWFVHFDRSGTIRSLGSWSTRDLSLPAGARQVVIDELRAIRERGRPYRVDVAELAPDSVLGSQVRRLGIASVVAFPVRLAGQVWGLAVVARFGPQRFARDTEARMERFIGPVTATLANTEVRAELDEWHAEQAAVRRLTELATRDLRLAEVLQNVVVEASALVHGGAVMFARLEEDRQHGAVVAVSDDRFPVGLRFSADGYSAAARILRSAREKWEDDTIRKPRDPVAEQVRIAGVPVELDGQLWGVLGAASSDEPLPAGAENRLSRLAGTAVAAIASALARESLQRIAEEQAALLRVAQLVARGVGENELFNAVATEAAGLIGQEGANLARFDGPHTFTVIATCGGPAGVGVSVEVPPDDPGTVGEVIRTLRPARRDDYRLPSAPLFAGREYELGSSVSVPVIVEGRLWGMLGSVTEGRRLPSDTEDRLQQFAELVGAAIANTQARAEVELLADEQSALLRVAELVARGVREEDLFDAVALEAAGLIKNEATTLVRHDGSRTFTVLATCGGPAAVGTRFTVPVEDAGTMSELLRTGRPARLDSYEATTGQLYARRDYGVGSSVSVPIFVEDRLWGSIGALTEGRQLPANTEARLQKFAELVAAAIANSQARTEIMQLADEQAALRRVAELVARGASLPEVFAGISTEASRLLADVAAALLKFEAGSYVEIVAAHNSPAQVGMRIPLEENDIALMFGSGQAVQLAEFPDTALATVTRELGLSPGTVVPITVEGRLWGALKTSRAKSDSPLAADRELHISTAEKLEKFAALAAAAIANAENKAQLTASRARVVATADEARRRLQRDVHDGAQQRLVQTVLTLKLARESAAAGEPTDELVEEALHYAERATVELRDLVHGILPGALNRGLRSGVESLIGDVPTPVHLDFSAPLLPDKTEITAYFIVAEALTNVVKHAAARQTSVRVALDADHLIVEVRDDGRGGADAARGSGLTGLMDRVETAEGTLAVISPPGGGTTLRATLPVAWPTPPQK